MTTTSEGEQLSKRAAGMLRRRRGILSSAVELFVERGYLGTTVDEIAERAGLTKRTVYHHMGNKEQILKEIHADFIDEGLRRWKLAEAQGGTATESLRRLILSHVQIVADHRDAIAVFFDEIKHLTPVDREAILRERDQYEDILLRTLERGIAAGEFRELDLVGATKLILGGLTEIYRWYDPKGKLSVKSIADVLSETFLDGIRTP